jgi:hypothetical protein
MGDRRVIALLARQQLIRQDQPAEGDARQLTGRPRWQAAALKSQVPSNCSAMLDQLQRWHLVGRYEGQAVGGAVEELAAVTISKYEALQVGPESVSDKVSGAITDKVLGERALVRLDLFPGRSGPPAAPRAGGPVGLRPAPAAARAERGIPAADGRHAPAHPAGPLPGPPADRRASLAYADLRSTPSECRGSSCEVSSNVILTATQRAVEPACIGRARRAPVFRASS